MNDATAKPTMWQEQPTTAAPPARSIALIASGVEAGLLSTGDATEIHIAADEVGIVSRIPITTEITTPIIKGAASVARAISAPSWLMSQIKG